VGIAAGRRAPLHVNDFGAVVGEVHGEQLEPDIDDARRRCEQAARVFLFGLCWWRQDVAPPVSRVNVPSSLRGTQERVRTVEDAWLSASSGAREAMERLRGTEARAK
jgi:hypothetical protein